LFTILAESDFVLDDLDDLEDGLEDGLESDTTADATSGFGDVALGFGADFDPDLAEARRPAALTLPAACWCMGTFRLAIALEADRPFLGGMAGDILVVSPYVQLMEASKFAGTPRP
jgi:hypothetical protein